MIVAWWTWVRYGGRWEQSKNCGARLDGGAQKELQNCDRQHETWKDRERNCNSPQSIHVSGFSLPLDPLVNIARTHRWDTWWCTDDLKIATPQTEIVLLGRHVEASPSCVPLKNCAESTGTGDMCSISECKLQLVEMALSISVRSPMFSHCFGTGPWNKVGAAPPEGLMSEIGDVRPPGLRRAKEESESYVV